jgi:hypothetical protein
MDALEQRSILYRASLASVEAEIYCRIKDELYVCDLREQGIKMDVAGSRRLNYKVLAMQELLHRQYYM